MAAPRRQRARQPKSIKLSYGKPRSLNRLSLVLQEDGYHESRVLVNEESNIPVFSEHGLWKWTFKIHM